MSGITHLLDIYKKKGKEFIDNLFNQNLIINEKMDFSRLSFVKKQNNSFDYYKRDTSKPIDKIDRTLMVFYETAINYIESLPQEIVNQIPVGWKFGTEYGLTPQSHEICYDRTPKNNLILSDITTNEGTTIQDKESLDRWADLLGIERAPILFQGKLTEDQKIQLLEFLNTPFNQLIEKFKTTSFVNYILSIICPERNSSTLNEDRNKPIEGLVFRFGDDREKPVLAKLVDPLFTELAKQKTDIKLKRSLQPNDIYHITLADVTSFISSLNFKQYECNGLDANEKYINFISNIFNDFINEYGHKYKGLDFDEPDYLKKEEFKMNHDLIKNESTSILINSHPSYESLFRIMLNAFRKNKTKKSVNDIFNEGILSEFNNIVTKIENYVNGILVESDSNFLTFSEFRIKNNPMSFVAEDDEEPNEDPAEDFKELEVLKQFKDDSDQDDKDSFEEPTDPTKQFKSDEEIAKDNEEQLKVELKKKGEESKLRKADTIINYFTTPKDEDLSHNKELRGKKECVIFVGRFQPFHNGHLKTISTVKAQTGLPVILAVINSGEQSEKNAFTERVQKTMLDELKKAKLIDDYVFLKTGFFGHIIRAVRPNYEPRVFACGEDRSGSYQIQLEYMKNKAPQINMNPLAEILTIDRISSATSVREMILCDDFQGFKISVPKCLINLWELFKSEIFRPTPKID